MFCCLCLLSLCSLCVVCCCSYLCSLMVKFGECVVSVRCVCLLRVCVLFVDVVVCDCC